MSTKALPIILAVGAVTAAGAATAVYIQLKSQAKASKSSQGGADPGPLPPQPDLEFDEDAVLGPDGEPMPSLGNPYLDPCVKVAYGGSNRVDESVLKLMNNRARAVVTPPDGRWTWVDSQGVVRRFARGMTYLNPLYQRIVFQAAVNAFAKDRQVISLTTRDILKRIMPLCNWDVDMYRTPGAHHEYKNKDQHNMWLSVWHLVTAASRMNYKNPYRIGGGHPMDNLFIPDASKPGLIVGRGYLNLADVGTPGSMSLKVGQRVELVVGEYRRPELPYPAMFHSERLYARVVSGGGSPTVEILGEFRGNDVAPKFYRHHGFESGQRVRLGSKTTTGIRRVFKQGIA